MRFVAIALFLLAIPVLQNWMQGQVQRQRWVWRAIGFLPFAIGWLHLDASLISWAMWPGYVRGLMLSLLDALAVATLLTLRKDRLSRPYLYLLGLYAAVASLSIAFADVKMAAFFFVWQLLRMVVVFLAVRRIAVQPGGLGNLIEGILAGAVVQAGYSINERLHGVGQATGTMGHQNLLGMMLHFAIYPGLALLLAGRRDKLLMAGVAASVVAIVLTGSRASIGIAAIGISLLIVLSMIRRPTSRKSTIVALGVVAMLLATPLAWSGLSKRLTADSIASSDGERQAFKRAAWMMVRDHPMGVGANQYVVVANSGGYSERAGVNWNSTSRSANVHNTYLLMTAELGYLGGLATLLLMILPPLSALRAAWRVRHEPVGDVILGLGTALAAVAVHCNYEWIYVYASTQYLHAICLGMLSGLVAQQQAARRRKKRKPVAAVPVRRLALSEAA